MDRQLERLQQSQALRGERTGHRVAADHDRLRLARPRIAEHGFERIDVAVNVVQREYVHRVSLAQPDGCVSVLHRLLPIGQRFFRELQWKEAAPEVV
jgi:hypothetical protein